MLKRPFPTFLRLLGALSGLLLILCPFDQAQQDIQVVSGSSPYTIFGRGLSWAGSGPGNINNNWIYTPVDPNQGFCLFVSNNNPSNSHSFSVSVFQSGDPAQAQRGFTGFAQKWFPVPTQQAFPVTVNAFGIVGISFKTSGSAGITVQITGGTVAGGSPDTADVFADQTTQNACGSLTSNSVQGIFQQGTTVTLANQFPILIGGLPNPGSTTTAQGYHIGTTGNGFLPDGGACCQSITQGFINTPSSSFSNTKAATNASTEVESMQGVIPISTFGAKGVIGGFVKTNFLELATDQFNLTQSNTPAWVVLGKLTNPAAGATLLHLFNGTASAVNPALKTLTLSCSVACELTVGRTIALGTTCTALTAQNLQFGNGGTQQAPAAGTTQQNSCATAPTASTLMYDLQLGAGTVSNLDLAGFADFHNATTGSGIDVIVVGTITGVATASLTWAEQ